MTNIKVGDTVRVKDEQNTGFWHWFRGRTGVVRAVNGNRITVNFSDDESDTGWEKGVELIAPPVPAIPDEIEINGAKYRRVIEEATPEKPTPQAGQVWKYTNYYIIVTNNDRNTIIRSGRIGDMDHDAIRRLATFIAPSLADALERGLITAADLR